MLCDYCAHENSCTKILSQTRVCKDFLHINCVNLITVKAGDILYAMVRFNGMSSPAKVAIYKITKEDFNYLTGILYDPDGGIVMNYKINRAGNMLFRCREDAEIICDDWNKITEWR